MRVPYWLLRLLPMWEYICPACRKEVMRNSHKCPHCGERFLLAIRVPPNFLKNPKKLEAYVHKQVFPRISPLLRAYLTQFFTTILDSDFEEGDFSEYEGTYTAGTGAAADVDDAIAHHGDYSAKFTSLGTDYYTIAVAYASIAGYNPVYTRFYFLLDTLPSDPNGFATLQSYQHYGSPLGNMLFNTRMRISNGNIQLGYHFETGGENFGNISIAVNEWHCAESGAYEHATEGWVKLDYDGSLLVSETDIDTTSTHFPVRSGVCLCQTARPFGSGQAIARIDCVIMADERSGPEIAGTITGNTPITVAMNNLLAYKPKPLFPKFNPRVIA